jgi:hypothetical protein
MSLIFLRLSTNGDTVSYKENMLEQAKAFFLLAPHWVIGLCPIRLHTEKKDAGGSKDCNVVSGGWWVAGDESKESLDLFIFYKFSLYTLYTNGVPSYI